MTQLEIVNPKEYFHQQISEAKSSLNITLSDHIEFYIVNLMCEFIDPTQIGIEDLDTPLAFKLKHALESSPEIQLKSLKKLGDTSLYLAGYFQDYFNKKTYDIDYYIAMGSSAYSRISRGRQDTHFSDLYDNLSRQFSQLVELIAQVSDHFGDRSQVDLLSTYERWTKNQSSRLRKILEDEGIVPITDSMAKPQ